jgi:hypothetical protein
MISSSSKKAWKSRLFERPNINLKFSVFKLLQILPIAKQYYICNCFLIQNQKQKLKLWRTTTTKKEWRASIANASEPENVEPISLTLELPGATIITLRLPKAAKSLMKTGTTGISYFCTKKISINF